MLQVHFFFYLSISQELIWTDRVRSQVYKRFIYTYQKILIWSVMLSQQRLDKIQHPVMKCNLQVRFQGTCTLFYPKGVNALMNSAAFFSETLHNDSWDTQGKFTVGPWTSHFRDSPNDIPLTFWTYWVFAEQLQFVVSDWAAGFGIAADYSLHIYQMCAIFSRLRFG